MTDKKNDLGFDPLAWADDGSNNSLNIELLEQSFAALAPRAGELVKRFYDDLYSRYPAVRPLFKNTTSEAQQTKLVAALQLVIKQLRDPSQLTNTLQQLGKKHQQYGAIEAHYSAVAETLLAVMADMAGDLWTPEVANAWSQALTKIAEIMLGAYESNEGVTMSTSSSDNSNVLGDLKIITDIMDNAPVNIMIADDDENVIYVNNRAKAVLTELESELQKYLPQFSVATVVGGSIHRYHKDPQAIKNIIQGLRPGESRKGEIKPGPFVFEHETRPLMNANGQRLGWVVQWHDVTERRKKEEEAFRLFRAVDSAQTAMMMIDRDLTITYINKSTEELLKRNQEDLAKIYPGFNANNIIGTCIDIFHKNPAHQRKILGDAANLPFETDIQVGPLIFHIRVGAMNDLDGNYIGCTLEWSDVTDLRAKEIEVARLKS
ncbi:MAG: PAS domain-containing protein, partial [Gammaproteobacteria bacterium]|nr:PAS domain-containing protein [Gammaproteobacteria bacterium]